MKKQQSFAKIPSISPERVFFFEVARIAPVIASAAFYFELILISYEKKHYRLGHKWYQDSPGLVL